MIVADSLHPANIPADVAGVIGTEVDNTDNPGAWAQLVETHPTVDKIMIIVRADFDPVGVPPLAAILAADVEPGALTPAAALEVIARSPNRPWLWYCDHGSAGYNIAAAQAAGVRFAPPVAWPLPGIYLWDADWTGSPHVNPGSLLTQYIGSAVGRDYDLSLSNRAAALFPQLAVPAPPDPPAPPALKEDTVEVRIGSNGQVVIVGNATDNGDLMMFATNPDGVGLTVIDITEKLHAMNPADDRAYRIT